MSGTGTDKGKLATPEAPSTSWQPGEQGGVHKQAMLVGSWRLPQGRRGSGRGCSSAWPCNLAPSPGLSSRPEGNHQGAQHLLPIPHTLQLPPPPARGREAVLLSWRSTAQRCLGLDWGTRKAQDRNRCIRGKVLCAAEMLQASSRINDSGGGGEKRELAPTAFHLQCPPAH